MVSTDSGMVLRQFGKFGFGPSEFRDPSGVVCDADGLIVVGDSRNHRLQVRKGEADRKFFFLFDLNFCLKFV